MPRPGRALAVTCGIRVDGRDVGLNLPGLGDAMRAVLALHADGFRDVEVFERQSGQKIPMDIAEE
jgi:hypothetical protein